MKRIGILGGVGPQATTYIYQNIIKLACDTYGAIDNSDYPFLVIASVPVPDFISDKSNINKAKEMLVDAAQGLVASGCDVLCIGSNTVHILLEDIRLATKKPFLSMVDLVAEECNHRDCKKVALLGTPVLIESGIYDSALSKYDIELITPNEKQEAICGKVIRCVIGGKSIEEIKDDYVSVLNDMFSSGADAIILGCTELPMVLNYEALGNRIISSDEILAKGIADCYYDKT